jgi:hypothetical protein
LPVKVYPVALSQVTVSLNHVTIAITSPLVRLPEAGLYSTVAVGEVVSGSATLSIMKSSDKLNVLHNEPSHASPLRLYVPSPVLVLSRVNPVVEIFPVNVSNVFPPVSVR